MLWLASFTVAAGLAALVALLHPLSSPADPVKSDSSVVPAAIQAGPQLPISQCVLFSSGVGFFQREGEVDGNVRVDLTFPVTDVNDLLKSMVLQDLGGGHVAAVSYDSHDPIDKTLKSFAVNLTSNPGYGAILDQARGEKVEVTQQQAANQPGTLTGTVVGVEKQRQPAGKDGVVEIELLNLWCAEGLRSVKLADVQRVRFLNPIMESEFRRALEVLALSHDTAKKAVSLNFEGAGKRPVRVGYVVENPIWKTSYRLVLNKEGKAMLQGWAVVENPTDEDWKDVKMALVSGRPISFQMDLYQPLYVPRPTVVPELFASLQPRTYNGAMEGAPGAAPAEQMLKQKAEAKEALSDMPPPATVASPQMDSSAGFGVVGGAAGYKLATIDPAKGVTSAASAQQLGTYYVYTIQHAVNLPRQKSALLPIVDKTVEGTKVSIYNESTHAKFPLLGLKFKNTSGLNLMQGPITVFDNNNYAGDARILDLQPNEERLLSYAVDLGTEVEAVPQPGSGRLTKVKVEKGILISTTKVREGKTYNAKNRAEQDRLLIIEHPYRPDFTLVSKDKPSERASDVYRFEIKVPAGKTASTEVVEERDVQQQVALTNSDDQTIRYFLTSQVSSPKVQEALKKAIDLKGRVVSTQQELAQVEKRLKDISEDQGRLRANLKEMPPTAAAYKRYLEKFDTQETEIEKLQASQKHLQEVELTRRQEYEAYLGSLDVE
jgi:hypothetical protein